MHDTTPNPLTLALSPRGGTCLTLAKRCAILSAALLLAACAEPQPVALPPRPVRVVAAQFEATRTTARYAGEVNVRHEAALAFQVGGKLISRRVDVGATVRRAEVLATLDPPDLQLNQANNAAQLRAAETELSQARKELRHSENLLAQDLTSPAHHERKLDAMRGAEARVAQAQAALALSARQSGYAELRADRDGVVTAVEAEVGQVLSAGQAVIRLAHTDEKEVVIHVPENRLDELRTATAIKVSLWANPGVSYPAKLREISPGVDATLRMFTVKLAVPSADAAMRLGMTATAQVERLAAQPVAWLPLTALTARGGRAVVWVVDPATHRVAPQTVTAGPYEEDRVPILDGLRQGQQVVVAGVQKLTPGQPVRLLAEEAR